jgi:hypothetical protein
MTIPDLYINDSTYKYVCVCVCRGRGGGEKTHTHTHTKQMFDALTLNCYIKISSQIYRKPCEMYLINIITPGATHLMYGFAQNYISTNYTWQPETYGSHESKHY